MRSAGVEVCLGVTMLALLLSIDMAQSKSSKYSGGRKCAKDAVEQEECTNTGDPDQAVGLCLPDNHPHTLANSPKRRGSRSAPGSSSGSGSSEKKKSRLICVPPIRCCDLPNVYFGYWDLTNAGQSTYPATASLTCPNGYQHAGSSTIGCRLNGTWEDTTSECQPVNCGDPPVITDGTWTPEGNKAYGDHAQLVCGEGYEVDSCTAIVCQADGTWSSSAASCKKKDCKRPPTIIDGEFTASTTAYLSVATISCNNGYSPSDTTASVTCGSDGSWSTSQATCKPANCGYHPQISNGDWSMGDMTYGAFSTLTCDTGYWCDACSPIECQADGTWSSSAASCTPVDCKRPPTILNGEFTASTTTYLSVANISCNSGYSPSETAASVTCGSDGSWSTSPATCKPANCGYPPQISNGAWSMGDMTYGAISTLTCKNGYWNDICSFIECQADGNWSSSVASCTPVDCGFTPPFTNGEFIANSSTYLGVGGINCDDGFSPSDPSATVVCGADGSWSAQQATCERIECEAGWVELGDNCYIYMGSVKRTFNDALADCDNLGGQLVSIETQAENALLKGYANEISIDEWWIAITDQEVDGWWKYANSGANVTFFDWAPNQPNNWGGEQDCGSMWFENTGWQDAACLNSLTVICEKSRYESAPQSNFT